jgi:hypothetical protein
VYQIRVWQGLVSVWLSVYLNSNVRHGRLLDVSLQGWWRWHEATWLCPINLAVADSNILPYEKCLQP